jgi:hypothetical protein
VETRARFGYTAPVGTTDDGRFRRLTVHLPPAYAQRLFNARTAGASDQQMRQIIAEGLKEIYFQDGGSRALELSDVAINDIDYLDLDYCGGCPHHSTDSSRCHSLEGRSGKTAPDTPSAHYSAGDASDQAR